MADAVRVEGHKGYLRRATGETDFAKESERALTILGEINERKAQAIPLQKKNFAEVADSFVRLAKARMDEGRSSQGRNSLLAPSAAQALQRAVLSVSIFRTGQAVSG